MIVTCILYNYFHIIHIYFGITRGRVLNSELYAQRVRKLIYLYLFTNCFTTIYIYLNCSKDWREIFMGQSVNTYSTDKLASVIFVKLEFIYSVVRIYTIKPISNMIHTRARKHEHVTNVGRSCDVFVQTHYNTIIVLLT